MPRCSRGCAALLIASSATACFSGFGSSQPVTELEVGGDGGRMTVQSGFLEGMTVTVPAGTFDHPVQLRVAMGEPTTETGWQVVGATAWIQPEDVELRRPIAVSLPFERGLVPVGVAMEDLVVMHRGAGGHVTAVAPYAVHAKKGFVDAQLSALGTVWVASPASGTIAEPLSYFPLHDGNLWEFGGGVSLSLRREAAVPHLPGEHWVWTMRADGQELSFYLGETEGGGIHDLGRESSTLGLQEIMDRPLLLFPPDFQGARRLVSRSDSDVYAPIGAPTPVGRGERTSLTEVRGSTVVTGPLGPFEDALEVGLGQQWELAGMKGGLEVWLWFAAAVGPVQLRIAGGPDLPLIRSRVNGVSRGI